MKLNKRMIYLIITCFTFGLVFIACGEKGPPLPPEIVGEKISEPYDLRLNQSDNVIFLSWSHRIDPVDAHIEPESFDVYMATKDMQACKGCPFLFELAAKVPMPKKEFITRVKPGYKYYFRIQATGKDDKKSDYSKTVQLEIK